MNRIGCDFCGRKIGVDEYYYRTVLRRQKSVAAAPYIVPPGPLDICMNCFRMDVLPKAHCSQTVDDLELF